MAKPNYRKIARKIADAHKESGYPGDLILTFTHEVENAVDKITPEEGVKMIQKRFKFEDLYEWVLKPLVRELVTEGVTSELAEILPTEEMYYY